MTFFVLFSERPLVRIFGWSLLHFVWEGVIVAVLLSWLLKLLSGRTPQLRYVAALCGLVLMTILPLITSGYMAITSNAMDHAITYSNVDKGLVVGLHSSFSGAAGTWLDQIAASLDRSLPWVLAAWFTGVLLFLGRLNIGLIIARRIKSVATQPASPELQLVFQKVKCCLRIERTVRLAHSALVQVPTVIGWLRPVVLIPVGCFTGLSPIQIDSIFAHELAHIRRQDYLVSVLQSVAEAVLFYHPAVWWVSAQVRKERENCCDDVMVRTSGDSLAYAKALSHLEERRSIYAAIHLGANGGALVMRIKRLLGYKEAPAFSQLAGIGLLALMVAAAALGIGTLARAQASGDMKLPAEHDAASQATPQMYQKWLDEDVVWIISPEERARFVKLSSDSERNEFIKQFWERRDAQSPGGGENSFRAEYYGRIAYANQHFRGVTPGWRTDRGRVYILYGPPDSIDAHLSVRGATKPYELWHYRVIQEETPEQVKGTQDYKTTIVTRKDVDMKFVDTCSCGNLQLQRSEKR
ncbi:MAG TPA: GWxTD domain-containing protein [Acidobacteriaceae bacterium]